MTVKEFCRRYSIGKTTTDNLLNTGAIAAKKFGTRTVIDPESAERWFQGLPTYSKPPKRPSGPAASGTSHPGGRQPRPYHRRRGPEPARVLQSGSQSARQPNR